MTQVALAVGGLITVAFGVAFALGWKSVRTYRSSRRGGFRPTTI